MKRLRHAHEDPRERVLFLQAVARHYAEFAQIHARKDTWDSALRLQRASAILYGLARREYISYHIVITPPYRGDFLSSTEAMEQRAFPS